MSLQESVFKSIIPYSSTNVKDFVDKMNDFDIKDKYNELMKLGEKIKMEFPTIIIIDKIKNPIKEFNKSSNLKIFAFTKIKDGIKIVDINNDGEVDMENAKYVAFILIDLVRENDNDPFKPQFRPITFDILENKINNFNAENYISKKELKNVIFKQPKQFSTGATKKNKKRLGGTKKKVNYKKKNKSVKRGKRGKIGKKGGTKKNAQDKNKKMKLIDTSTIGNDEYNAALGLMELNKNNSSYLSPPSTPRKKKLETPSPSPLETIGISSPLSNIPPAKNDYPEKPWLMEGYSPLVKKRKK